MKKRITKKAEQMMAIANRCNINLSYEMALSKATKCVKKEICSSVIMLIVIIVGMSYSIRFQVASYPMYAQYSYLRFFAENNGPAWMISWNNFLGAITTIVFMAVLGIAITLSKKFLRYIGVFCHQILFKFFVK